MVDETTKNRWKKEDALKKEKGEEKIKLSEFNTKKLQSLQDQVNKYLKEDNMTVFSRPEGYTPPNATLFGSAYPSEPILTSKVSGWVGVFGDHYLCELGCKKFVSKKLDDVIKFFEREVRLWYKAKELAKKGKLDVEVKGHVRKSRKKKEITFDYTAEKVKIDTPPDDHEEHIKANIEYAGKLVKDEVEKGKVLFVKDENIKVEDEKDKV